MTESRRLGLAICLLANLAALPSQAQDAQAEIPIPERGEWLEQRTKEFVSYRIALEGLRQTPLVMEPQPLLDWSNARRGTRFGATFLWTYEGRPELIANGYGRGPWLRHEFHSLSREPIVADRAGNRVHRFEPGIEWRDLVEAPKAAASRPLRLTQMRRQAERFRVTMTMANKPPAEMRLLTQPIYRSPETIADDVAVFVFVQGTDPECVLLLEITADKNWRYALARQTQSAVNAELDGQQVLDLHGIPVVPAGPDAAYMLVKPPEAQ